MKMKKMKICIERCGLHSESVVIQFPFLADLLWPVCSGGMDKVEVEIWLSPFFDEEAIEIAE